MEKEEAVSIVLERLAKNGDEAKQMYAYASMSIAPVLHYGASPQWFYDRMQEYRRAEYALQEGNVAPAVKLLNSLIRSASTVGLSQDIFRRGKFPIICLRDGLLGIDTPSLPDLPAPKRTLLGRLLGI